MRIEGQYTRVEDEMTMSDQRCKSAVVEGGEATEKDSKLVGSERKVFTCSQRCIFLPKTNTSALTLFKKRPCTR